MHLNIAIRKSKKRDVVTKLVSHFTSLLCLERSSVAVTVVSLAGYLKEHGAYGGVNVDGKHITIALDSKLSRFQTIMVLAHEMIHVRQVALGKLRYSSDRAIWCGRDLHDLPYNEKPWEIQAHSQTPVLIKQLLLKLQ